MRPIAQLPVRQSVPNQPTPPLPHSAAKKLITPIRPEWHNYKYEKAPTPTDRWAKVLKAPFDPNYTVQGVTVARRRICKGCSSSLRSIKASRDVASGANDPTAGLDRKF